MPQLFPLLTNTAQRVVNKDQQKEIEKKKALSPVFVAPKAPAKKEVVAKSMEFPVSEKGKKVIEKQIGFAEQEAAKPKTLFSTLTTNDYYSLKEKVPSMGEKIKFITDVGKYNQAQKGKSGSWGEPTESQKLAKEYAYDIAYSGDITSPLAGTIKKVGGQVVKEAVESKLKQFDPVAYVKENVAKREAARVAEKPGIIDRAKNLYSYLKKSIVDSNSPIEDVLEKAQKEGGFEVLPKANISDQVDRVYRSPSLASSFVKESGFDKVIQGVDDLDALDQYLIAKHAPEVEAQGFKTGRDLTQDKALVESLQDKYEPFAKQVNDYSRKLLDYTTESGLISKELADNLKKQYPNYVPINRIFDELELSDVAKTQPSGVASISKQSVVQKLKGSEREIESPIASLLLKTNDAFTQAERNKAAQILTTYKDLPGNPFGLKPIRTAEQVEKRRLAFKELALLKKEFQGIKESLSVTNANDRKLLSKISNINKEIDAFSEEAIDVFIKGETDDPVKIIQELRTKIDDSKALRDFEKQSKQFTADSAVLKAQTKDRLKVLSQDASKAQNEVNKLRKQYESKILETIEGGTNPATVRLEKQLEQAQSDLLNILSEKEFILSKSEQGIAPPIKADPVTTISSQNVGPTPKVVIEKNIIKRKDADIEKLKQKITTRENKLAQVEADKFNTEVKLDAFISNFKTKKQQIRSVFEDIKNLSSPKVEQGQSTLSVFRNGIQEKWVVKNDVAESAKRLNVKQLGLLEKVLAIPVRIAKAGITGFSLPFQLANVGVDQLTALINSKNSLRTSIANPKMFIRALFETIGHGKLYQEMVKNAGGGTSFDILRDAPIQTVKDIRSRKSIPSRAKYLVTNPSQLLRSFENILSRGEELTRMQQYLGTKEALTKQGRNTSDVQQLAARAARKTTTDFYRKGDFGNAMNAALLYMNASIQGSRAWIRRLAEAPVETSAKIATTLLMPSAIITAWNMSDPKRREAYLDTAEYEREGNMIIVPNDPEKDENGMWNVVKYKIPPGLSKLTIPVRRAIEQAYGGDKVAFAEIVNSILSSPLPFDVAEIENGKASFDEGSVLSALTPQIIKPSVEAYANKNLFTGFPIVPESMKNLPPELQVKPKTSGSARIIGGSLDVSPIKVEEFIRASAGNFGQQILNGIDRALAGLDVIPKEQVGGKSITEGIIGRFGKARGGETEQKSIQEIRDILQNQEADRFKLNQEAEIIFGELKAMTDKQSRVDKYKELKKTNPELVKAVDKVAEDFELGLGYEERLMKQMGVENGERAKFIYLKMKSIEDPQTRIDYYKELRRQKVISDEVDKQINMIVKSKTSN